MKFSFDKAFFSLTVVLSSSSIFLICVIMQEITHLRVLKAQTILYEKKIADLLTKADSLKISLLEAAQGPAPISVVTSVESNDTPIIIFTVLVMFGIFFFYYYTSVGPLFCPVRTMSSFDSFGNQIMLGIRYPVDSPVSASIRLAGTPEAIPLAKFAKTILDNPNLKQGVVNEIAPVVLQNGIPVFEKCKLFLSYMVHLFI